MKYVEFTEVPEGMLVTLLPAGRLFLLEELRSDPAFIAAGCDWKRGTKYIFLDVIEWQLENGWVEILPEDMGALTDSIFLCQDARCEGVPNSPTSPVYWQPRYAVDDELKDLLEKGSYTFARVPI